MSEELDLVHLIDAKIGTVRAKAARSRVATVLANEDLDQHRQWFERQRSLSSEAVRQRRNRLVRERDAEARRKRTEARALRIRSLGAGLLRGVESGLTSLGTRLWLGLEWIVASAVSGLASLGLLLTWIAARGLAYWPSLLRRLNTGMAWLAAQARAAGLSLAKGFERIGARISSRLHDLGQSHIRTVRRGGEALRKRRRDAAMARSRAERDRLQNKIHALGQAKRSRPATAMRPAEPEHRAQQPEQEGWSELRQLALRARRGVERQDRERRGAVAWRGSSDPRIAGSTLWSRADAPQGVSSGKAGPRLDGLANVLGIGTVSHRLP